MIQNPGCDVQEPIVFEKKAIERISSEAALQAGVTLTPRDLEVICNFVASLRPGGRTTPDEIAYVTQERYKGNLLSP